MTTSASHPPTSALVRRAVTVRGAVQGVGYRPFVYRLATELGLTGWVLNGTQGLFVEVEGTPDGVDSFCRLLQLEAPPRAMVQGLKIEELPAVGYTNFSIRHSNGDGPPTTIVLPDIATCPDCLREILDPNDRRYGYPFTNCTNCGPRYSIIRRLPYDRPHTAMADFPLCPACQAEYDNPLDRRFHAQPNACPVCGPQLAFWDSRGKELATRNDALSAAAKAIRQGLIVAVKGLGGFHLLVDARNTDAVELLRRRKQRPRKPFAVMFPNRAQTGACCQLSTAEAALLESPAAPIVLLHREAGAALRSESVSPAVAPDNPTLGVFLPYTPLHHLLLAELGFPVVATSGNLFDEPICIDNDEAVARLAGIADYFLVHDRPIERPVDDSVVRVLAGETQILRRSRGYAPLPISRPDRWAVRPSGNAQSVAPPTCQVLAVGGHMKDTVALAVDGNVFLSQHLGDLENTHAFSAFAQAIDSLSSLYEAKPDVIVCDSHPDYPSARFAARLAAERNVPLVKVQHHYAHILACMAENQKLDFCEKSNFSPVLGIAWDGTGYGPDGTIWGGECLLVKGDGFRRIAHLRPFRLPGGEAAVREPRRSAFGLLHECFGKKVLEWEWLPSVAALNADEQRLFGQMCARGVNAPVTTSAGRLFDGVASLLGLCQKSSFEGEAAMALEFAANGQSGKPYSFSLSVADGEVLVVDWQPLLEELLTDISRREPVGQCAARFHSTLAEIALAVAQRVDVPDVALTGGCFQNRLLSETTIERLRAAGFHPIWHKQVPPNDGGIALGQVVWGMMGRRDGRMAGR
jgi:hydrogenase maturation protein HypF